MVVGVPVSLYYPLSPVEELCPFCKGFGTVADAVCGPCDGIGRVWTTGGPSFGCKFALKNTKPGQIAMLGNGDRGRVVRHCKRGTPTTEVLLIDPFLEEEAATPTTYPSVTGVISMSASSWFEDPHGESRGKQDHLDPLQQQRTKTL